MKYFLTVQDDNGETLLEMEREHWEFVQEQVEKLHRQHPEITSEVTDF